MNLALPAVASPEALNTPGGIHHSLLSGEERMALIAQLYLYLLLGGADSEGIATGTGRLSILIIIGVNLIFHGILYATPALTGVYTGFPPVIPRRLVLDDAIDQGKEGVVPAHTNVVTGMNPRTPLSHQYRPGTDDLSGITFHAQTLPLAITTVFGAATTLLMRHCRFPLSCGGFSSGQSSRMLSPAQLSRR